MSQYISGIAAFTADNFIIDGDDSCPRHMLLPGCFDDFDFASPVAILANHDWNQRLGAVGDNARLWMDRSKLRFSCMLKSTAAADRFLEAHMHARVLGCSIRCQGFSETHYDRNGRPYAAISKVFSIQDVGPVSTARNPFCHGMVVSDGPGTPQRPSALQMPAVTNSWHARKKLMTVGPMPAAGMNGLAIANPAATGVGCVAKGIRLSASTVQGLITNRQHAIL